MLGAESASKNKSTWDTSIIEYIGSLQKEGEIMRKARFWIQNWEKLTAFGFGIVFIAVLLVIAYLVPNPTVTQSNWSFR